jgi:hypothetical protein
MKCKHCKKELKVIKGLNPCAVISNKTFCVDCGLRVVSYWNCKDELTWKYIPEGKIPVYEEGKIIELIDVPENLKSKVEEKPVKIKKKGKKGLSAQIVGKIAEIAELEAKLTLEGK